MSFKNYLKRSIVIVSRFGKRAGRTPGKYIERYTSRLDASEAMTPYVDPHDLSYYINSYMARKNASDDVISHVASLEQLRERDDTITPKSSRLFGNRGLVYSQTDFDEAIEVTEQANADDHTLILPVVSFSYEFLERMNVLKAGTEKAKHKGDYKGLVDQLKLRRAITKAVDSLCDKMHFVKPEWTGAIQLDTKNVHCHLTLVETSLDVPDKRFVYVPVKEKVTDPQTGETFERRMRDGSGRIVMKNIGERGKLTETAMDAFRTSLERELLYLKDLEPFVNKTSPHKQLVKEKSLELMLSNTKLVHDVAMIYQSLPKAKENDKSIPWRASSNAQDMVQANRLTRTFVRRVLNDHDLAVGFSDYKESVRAYTQFRLPEVGQEDFSKDRKRLVDLSIKRLEDELMNKLYDRLKDVRIVQTLDQYDFNQSNLLDRPFEQHADVVEGELSPLSLRFASLNDEQLKNVIADSYTDDRLRPLGSSLTLERRMREYPSRLEHHLNEVAYYERLTKEFAVAKIGNVVSEDAEVLGQFYEMELDRHERLRDKYLYLTSTGEHSFLKIDHRSYSMLRDDDWDRWLLENQAVLKHEDETFEHELYLTKKEERLFHQLPDSVQEFCGDSVFLKRECLLVQEKSQSIVKVSSERFHEVKFDDAMYTIYDIDPMSDRSVDDGLLTDSIEKTEQSVELSGRVLRYLERTNQVETAHLAYEKYSRVNRLDQEQLAFLNHTMVRGELPKPVRQSGDKESDLELLNVQLMLPCEKSISLSREFIRYTSNTLEEKKVTLIKDRQTAVDRSKSIEEELIRMNLLAYHKEQLEDEEEEYDDTLDRAVANVPLIDDIVQLEIVEQDESKDASSSNVVRMKESGISFG